MSRWFSGTPGNRPAFCVIGSPVAHSLSPAIHAAFGRQTGRELDYDRVEVAPGDVAAAVAEFREAGGVGLNVTVPLKEEAWRLAAHRRERARLAGAANTLWFDADGDVVCDNTDGTGLVRDLENNHGVLMQSLRVLLVGAGGAARGVAPALLAKQPASLTITNRTISKAEAIAADFEGPVPIEILPWRAAPGAAFDLVINATSLGLQGARPPLPTDVVHAGTVVYDMTYGEGSAAFLDWARNAGAARAIDGLGMLVEQAAEAFLLWHGERPETAPVMAALRQSLAR